MTYVYKYLSTSAIADALLADSNAGWSYEGARALAGHLEQMAEDTGEPIELDVVAMRCGFTEYADARSVADEYDAAPQWEESGDTEKHAEAVIEWLQDRATVIPLSNGGLIVGE